MDTGAYEIVVGLEVHAQLLTKSKLFCADPTNFGAEPNTQVSPISLAHPGTLPKMNRQAVELAVRLGLALHSEIEKNNYFARKNYFYPDLPKGYQVSQHTAPICKGGHISIHSESGSRDILLNRIHLEEDAGKSLHDVLEDKTCIDLNRAGVPLLEIVTEPCIHSAEEAFQFLTELRAILRWLDVCDGNMEEGSMRCDANISVRLKGETKLGTRVEVKNLNSIRNVKRAIEIESQRLIGLVSRQEPIRQETRSFDADNQTTFSLRSKEEAEDYRYFPEPDLPPFIITDEYLAEMIRQQPVMPETLKSRLTAEYGLTAYDAEQITSDKSTYAYFESVIKHTTRYKAVANWMQGPLKQFCNEQATSYGDIPLSIHQLASLIELVESGKVNFNNAATRIFRTMLERPGSMADQIAAELNLLQESDSDAVATWVDQVIAAMPDKVAEYQKGKKGLLGLFAGEVKKLSKGKADMALVNQLLGEKLKN